MLNDTLAAVAVPAVRDLLVTMLDDTVGWDAVYAAQDGLHATLVTLALVAPANNMVTGEVTPKLTTTGHLLAAAMKADRAAAAPAMREAA